MRAAVALALLVGATAAVADETADARRFVDSIYRQYVGKNARGVALGKSLERWFTRRTAKLIRADRAAAAKRHEVPNLDGDPFVDAQDWEIASYEVALETVSPVAMRATIKLTNAGRPTTIVLDLGAARPGWRVDEIHYPDDPAAGSLTKLVAGAH